MSKTKSKYDSLPKHQNKIVLCLAEKGPMIVRETNTLLHGEYTSTNRAFHELAKKEFIMKVDAMEYRKRQFPRFWLTDKGILYALTRDAKRNTLLEKAETIFAKDKDKQIFLKLLSKMPEQSLRIIFSLYSPGKEVSFEDVFSLVFSASTSKEKNRQLIEESLDLLAESPEYGKKANEVLDRISSLIDDLKKKRKVLGHE